MNKGTLKYRRSKKGVITLTYNSQRASSKKRGHDKPTYTLEDFREWMLSQKKFHVLYDNWKRLDYQKMYRPSVDRKDDSIGYTMANIQLMTWDENVKKAGVDSKSGKLCVRHRKVAQYSMAGEFIAEYVSVRQAGRMTGIDSSSISKNCKGKYKQIGGYIWAYSKCGSVLI